MTTLPGLGRPPFDRAVDLEASPPRGAEAHRGPTDRAAWEPEIGKWEV
jgi:hypothetical protein